MKQKNKGNQEKAPNSGIEGRLDALLALTIGVLREIAKDKKSKQVTGAEAKAIAALNSICMPQSEIGKLLGVDTHRVNEICRKQKRNNNERSRTA
jgi:hypothetical protein